MQHGPGSTRLAATFVALSFLIASCTSTETPTNPDPDPDDPTIALSIAPTSASVEQGGSTTFDGTATLGGTFSGAVTFGVTGLPSGVTVTVGTVAATSSTATATITIAAAASVAPGSYTGTVTATGSGVSDTETYTLTITAAAGYTLSAAPTSVSIDRNASADVTIALARTSFTEAVTLAAESLPTGVTASFDPASPTGASSTMTVAVGPSASAGTTTFTVRGTSSLADVTTTVDVTVTIPSAPNFTIDFSQCLPEDRPIWLAVSDGIGATWGVVTNVNDTYAITGLTQSTLGLTLVNQFGQDTEVGVQYVDASALSGLVDVCANDGTKTVNGTAIGFGSIATVALGSSRQTVFSGVPFTLTEVLDGELPFVGYALTDPGTGEGQMLIRRSQDIPDNGSLGTIDFGAEGFAPAKATVSVANLGGDDGVGSMSYAVPLTTDLCSLAPLYQVPVGASFSANSAPGSRQLAGELHVAQVTAAGNNTVRQVAEAFGTLANRTLTLPAEMPMPTLTDVTGSANYLLLQAEVTVPAEFDYDLTFSYGTTGENISVSYVGGLVSGTVTAAVPDLSGLTGWDDAWVPATDATGVEYLVGASNRQTDLLDLNPYYCVDGGRYVFGAYSGTYN